MDNRTVKKDPMMEIFIDECSDLVTQYETYLSMAAERNEYTMDIVNEIFRITHTIKADATMMLFECLAVPMRAFEHILYFYRDEKAAIDFDRFTELLEGLVAYSADEITLLMEDKASDNDGQDIAEEFKKYRDEIAGGLKVETVEDVEKTERSESHDEPMRFYIGSAEDSEGAGEKPDRYASIKGDTHTAMRVINEERAAAKAAKEQKKKCGPKKKCESAHDETEKTAKKILPGHLNSGDELKTLSAIVRHLTELETRMNESKAENPVVAPFALSLHERNMELLNWITSAATTPMGYISPKLHKTIEEMNQRMGRKIELEIEGEEILVNKEWIDGLSGALVHMLRNAVDHGIESKELRVSRGKPAEGKVTVSYANNGNAFTMTVSDDGRGIDIEKLKTSAIDRGLIFEGDELSKDDIIRLIFLPGVSTNEKEGIYSGRGVGMDAVLHNVEVLGGKITTDSEEGKGTTFTVTIPLRPVFDGQESTQEDEDEDIDSRR